MRQRINDTKSSWLVVLLITLICLGFIIAQEASALDLCVSPKGQIVEASAKKCKPSKGWTVTTVGTSVPAPPTTPPPVLPPAPTPGGVLVGRAADGSVLGELISDDWRLLIFHETTGLVIPYDRVFGEVAANFKRVYFTTNDCSGQAYIDGYEPVGRLKVVAFDETGVGPGARYFYVPHGLAPAMVSVGSSRLYGDECTPAAFTDLFAPAVEIPDLAAAGIVEFPAAPLYVSR